MGGDHTMKYNPENFPPEMKHNAMYYPMKMRWPLPFPEFDGIQWGLLLYHLILMSPDKLAVLRE